MNDRQVNRLMMFKAVRDFLHENAETLSAIPAMDRLIRELSEKVAAIQKTADTHATVHAGKTDVKYSAREALLEQLREKSSLLYSYARRYNRHETLALARRSDTEYRTLRDEELIHSGQVLFDEIRACSDALAEYGLSEQEIERFGDCIRNFDRALGERDSSKAIRTLSRTSLDSLFTEVGLLLSEELDPLMELYRSRDVRIFNTYRAYRVTKSLAVRYRKENGTADPLPPVQTTTPEPSVV